MGKTFNRIVRLLVLPGIADTQCGFKLFPRAMVQAVFPDLATEGFAFDVEVLARARRAGFAVVEVPVVWRNDARTRVRAGRDSLAMLADVVRLAWRLRRPTG
jgi:dolichyl-phosphate beta-glucosyltransferase